ncbi:SDR family NAD(P)-dependent oxidoreductase, partial [Burkholderia contaminans]
MSSRTYLVTGASRGIGLAISTLLARRGHRVIGLARHAQGTDFPGELRAWLAADLDAGAGGIGGSDGQAEGDGAVSTAGIVLPQPLGQIDFQSLQTVFDLNVRAAVQVTQHFAEAMKARGHGRIVNICSRAIFGSLDRTAYSAAKSAPVGCTHTWALELPEHGVTVNAGAPGPIETERFRQTRPVGSEAERKVLATIPARRLGTPDDVAAAIAFFLS